MAKNNAPEKRVKFDHGWPAALLAIDGTWQRRCIIQDVSDTSATLTVDGSVEGLSLAEFFLSLSSTGLAYRRCKLDWVNGDQMSVTFLKLRYKSKKAMTG